MKVIISIHAAVLQSLVKALTLDMRNSWCPCIEALAFSFRMPLWRLTPLKSTGDPEDQNEDMIWVPVTISDANVYWLWICFIWQFHQGYWMQQTSKMFLTTASLFACFNSSQNWTAKLKWGTAFKVVTDKLVYKEDWQCFSNNSQILM
jgi:hypothetical protein